MATSVITRVEEKLLAVRKSGRRPVRIELGEEEYRDLQDELSPIPNIAIPVLLGVRVSQVRSARRVAVIAGDMPVRTTVRGKRRASPAA
jgi:hypothetical protein